MKLIATIAAGLMAITGVAPLAMEAPAGAQTTVVRERTTVVRTRHHVNNRRATTRRVCTSRYRNGHRQRVCRTVRRYR